MGWAGDGAYFLHDVLEERMMVQCVLVGTEKESPPNGIHKLTRLFLLLKKSSGHGSTAR